jgi:hypothetical protein
MYPGRTIRADSLSRLEIQCPFFELSLIDSDYSTAFVEKNGQSIVIHRLFELVQEKEPDKITNFRKHGFSI